MKNILTIFLLLPVFLLYFVMPVSAESNSFVNVVNPIRGKDGWEEKYDPTVTIYGQVEVLTRLNIPATWLIRPDVFEDKELLNVIKDSIPQKHERGLFLEVTPIWSQKAGVIYRKSQSWHFAESVFLTGYEQKERIKLIDSSFENFKTIFGYYPKSVGAWWIDSFSLNYMQTKYGINSALIVSDQYSTDHYQIWGQFWSTPYFPAKTNALFPAQTIDDKLPVVISQWAARDPVNGYGKGVEESTLSVQPNDYIDFHKLDINYFTKLVDIYTTQNLNSFGQLVVGLENSYSWEKYKDEYQKEMQVLSDKSKKGQFELTTLNTFADWYIHKFTKVSPAHIIVADDPLQTNKKTIWFMNPYYRVGLFISNNEVAFRDIRQYIGGSKELCYDITCKSINFATNATRVLDEVTNGYKWKIDQGKIKDLNISKKDDRYLVEYKNQANEARVIEFLPRDIGIDGRISSIDSTILKAQENNLDTRNAQYRIDQNSISPISITNIIFNIAKFLIFLVFVILIPGMTVLNYVSKSQKLIENIFLSSSIGIVLVTLIAFISGIIKIWWLVGVYCIGMLVIFWLSKTYREAISLFNLNLVKSFISGKSKTNLILTLLILGGITLQIMPTFRSGSMTKYGLGFWGPNAHDGVWHMALVNELSKSIPPENPVFAGSSLTNYHYFYDLLIVVTNQLTAIPTQDLIFRFYPTVFSLLLGLGSYFLIRRLFNSKFIAIFSIYLIYFSGSFGWIVEYMKNKSLGGESAFWSNQPVSFNLNPPFAISLVILIALIYLLSIYSEIKSKKLALLLAVILGSLIGFKAYAAILAILAISIIALKSLLFERMTAYLSIFFGSVFIALLVILPNYKLDQLYQTSQGTFIFAPFWFVHSMIDSPDRVGLVRLSLARIAGLEQGNWFKFLSAESIGLIIFLVGNLGFRIMSMGLVFAKPESIFKDSARTFIFLITVFSFLFPLLFIQVGNPWNSVQFMYYGLYLTALGSGVVIYWLIKRLKFIGIGIALIILLLAPINAIATANSYLYPIPHVSLGVGELEALAFLANQPKGVVLTSPFNSSLRQGLVAPIPLVIYETSSYVAAFSKQTTFVEDEIQQQILQTDANSRITAANYFFKGSEIDWSKNFLKENNIQYVYIPKMLNISIEWEYLGLDSVFENKSAVIYKVR